jgi:hypothetical protein
VCKITSGNTYMNSALSRPEALREVVETLPAGAPRNRARTALKYLSQKRKGSES